MKRQLKKILALRNKGTAAKYIRGSRWFRKQQYIWMQQQMFNAVYFSLSVELKNYSLSDF